MLWENAGIGMPELEWNADGMPECILATALICWFVVNPVYLQ